MQVIIQSRYLYFSKSVLTTYIISIAIATCLLLTTSLHSAANDITPPPLTILSGEWTPYVGEFIEHNGFVAKIVSDSFKAINQPIAFKWLPWSRGEGLIKRGKYFASFPYAKTDLRRQNYFFSDPLFFTKTEFFYYKAHNLKVKFKHLNDIKHLRIGGIRGYGYVKRFKKAQMNLFLVNNSKQLIDMLERDRIDLIAINRSAGWDLIHRLHADNAHQFDTLDTPVNDTHGVHLLISKDYPQAVKLQTLFNQGLAIIKEKGTYDKILKELLPKGFMNE